jgi:predicted transcriptional regulator
MADGGLTLEIDSALAERLRAVATASGKGVEAFALEALRAAADEDWAEDYARVAEYEATGRFIPAEEAMAEFRAAVAARVAKK